MGQQLVDALSQCREGRSKRSGFQHERRKARRIDIEMVDRLLARWVERGGVEQVCLTSRMQPSLQCRFGFGDRRDFQLLSNDQGRQTA
jgi:hypothetical protein